MKITVNDITLYYERYGKGKPILMIHGNTEDHTIFDESIKELANDYQVYAIDSRAHGKSDACDVLDYEIMAEDMLAFINALSIKKPIVYGYSDGGIIALHMAMKAQQTIDRIIISGANLNLFGFKLETFTEILVHYLKTHSKYDRLMLKQKAIKNKDLQKITIQTHILLGKNDCITKRQTNRMHKMIRGSTLEIIDAEDHGSYIVHSKKLYEIMKKYLY